MIWSLLFFVLVSHLDKPFINRKYTNIIKNPVPTDGSNHLNSGLVQTSGENKFSILLINKGLVKTSPYLSFSNFLIGSCFSINS